MLFLSLLQFEIETELLFGGLIFFTDVKCAG